MGNYNSKPKTHVIVIYSLWAAAYSRYSESLYGDCPIPDVNVKHKNKSEQFAISKSYNSTSRKNIVQ
jgi:hypothetical protein